MKQSSAIKNAGWIIGCKIIKALLTLIVTMITARYLGPANYGLISYAASIVAFVAPIMKLGLDSILVHEIVNDEKNESKILGTSILMSLLSAIMCIIGIYLFVSIINAVEKETIIVCLIYSILLIFQAFEMIQYWFQAKLLAKYSSIAMLLSYILVTGFQIFLLITNKSVYWFAISNSMDYMIISLILYSIYKKQQTKKLSFSFDICKKMIKKSKYYILANLMVTIYAQTDKIMLKLMMDNASVGYYSAAVTCAGMASFVFAAIIDSARPLIFEAKKNNNLIKYEKGIISLYSIVIYFSIFICLIVTFLAPLIIKIMYGNEYINSISILRIIVWYTTFSYLGSARTIWIMAESKHNYLMLINSAGVFLNIFINYMLIPVYGISGAAIATVLTEIFVNYIITFFIKPIKNNNVLIAKALNINKCINLIKKSRGDYK